jgi:hypothetical protein
MSKIEINGQEYNINDENIDKISNIIFDYQIHSFTFGSVLVPKKCNITMILSPEGDNKLSKRLKLEGEKEKCSSYWEVDENTIEKIKEILNT